MVLDAEAKELIERLQDIEDRLISDEILEESVYSSIRTLEKIFGKKSIFRDLLKRLRSAHKVTRLDAAVRKAIRQTETSIEVANASAIFPHLRVNKNSVLSDFLADTGKLPKAKLREFHEFFARTSPILEKAFEKGDSKQIKKILREYIEVLESEEKYLQENIHQITQDIKHTWSVHNTMGHEVAHWVWGELSKSRNIYANALNEAYSFALQKLMHTFQEDYIFSKEKLLAEIRGLYQLIVPRKYAYNELQYRFMRPFIIFIGILILSDSIARKDGDYRNKKLFLESYSSPTLMKIFQLIEQSLNNLKNEELREIIRNTLLKTGINQLKKCKEEVIIDLESHLKKLPKYIQQETLVIGGANNWKNWTSFKDGLLAPGSVLNNNTRQFAASIDLLRIMGYEDKATKYQDRYLKILERTLRKIADYTNDKEAEIFRKEKHTVDGVIAVIEQEEKDLAEILQGLKF